MTSRSHLSRRAVVAGGAALALVGAVAGVAAAQAQSVPSETARPKPGPEKVAFRIEAPTEIREHHQKVMEAAAKRLGVTREKLEEALQEAHKEVGLPGGDFLMPVPGAHVRFFGAPGNVEQVAFAVRQEGKPPFVVSAGSDDEAAAQAIGISANELRQEMRDKSLAEVARARGVDPQKVVEALKSAAFAKIEQGKNDGQLSAEMAEQMKQDVGGAIERMIEHKPGADSGEGPIVRRIRHRLPELDRIHKSAP